MTTAFEPEQASVVSQLVIGIWGGDTEARDVAEGVLRGWESLSGYHALCALIRRLVPESEPQRDSFEVACGPHVERWLSGGGRDVVAATVEFANEFESISTLDQVSADPVGTMAALGATAAAAVFVSAESDLASPVKLLSDALTGLRPGRRLDEVSLDLDLPLFDIETISALQSVAMTLIESVSRSEWERSFAVLEFAEADAVLDVLEVAAQFVLGLMVPDLGSESPRELAERVHTSSPLAPFLGDAVVLEPYLFALLVDEPLPEDAYNEISFNQHFLLALGVYVGLCVMAADSEPGGATQLAVSALGVFALPAVVSE